jgi:hypothetical protein
MTFPAIDISTKKWIIDDLMEYVLHDEFIYTRKDSVFQKYYKDRLFCDGKGKIFKAVRKTEMTENWRNWLRFIPNVWKTKVVFHNTNKEMNLNDLQNYLLERISDLEQNDFTRKWKKDVLNAKTYSELING